MMWIIKTIKIVIYTGISIFLALFLLGIVNTYIYQYEPKKIDVMFPILINSVLGIPYHHYSAARENAEDITKFPMEEWFSHRCIPSDVDYNGRSLRKGGNERLPPNVTEKEVDYLNCLEVRSVNEYAAASSKTVNGELCNNDFNCRLINLAVKDYVLDKPEILWNLVKIIERPCDYIKPIEEAKDEEEKRYITSMQKMLYCDGTKPIFYIKERVFVKLVIQDLQNKRIAHVIVRRKDI